MQHTTIFLVYHGRECLLAEQLIDNSGVCALMSALICSNGTSDLAQDLVTIVLGMPCSVAMGDLGGTLLERGVYETQVWVVLSLGVHAAANEVLNGDFHSLHVDSAREHAVLVHQVTMSVLLCSPFTGPPAKNDARLSCT